MSKSLELAMPFLGKTVTVKMDRPLGTKHPRHEMVYEANYGYLEGIKAPDGEDLDAYYLGVNEPLQEASGICIAIIHRLDNDDEKLVVVPQGMQMSDEEIRQATHFQEQYFKSEIIRI